MSRSSNPVQVLSLQFNLMVLSLLGEIPLVVGIAVRYKINSDTRRQELQGNFVIETVKLLLMDKILHQLIR